MSRPVLTKTLAAPRLNLKEALRYMGAGVSSEDASRLLDECYREVGGGLIYKACYTEREIFIDGEDIELGFARLRSEALSRYLKGCFGIVLFVATVGLEIDRRVGRYSSLSPTRAFAYDALGSERVESLCDALCEELASEYGSRGVGLKNRFSPGYADFPLEVQRAVFSTLEPTAKIGVTLNDSLLMIPTKSVSAIIGLYKL